MCVCEPEHVMKFWSHGTRCLSSVIVIYSPSGIHNELLHEPSRFRFSVFEAKGGELYSRDSAKLAGPAQCTVSMDECGCGMLGDAGMLVQWGQRSCDDESAHLA